MSDVPRSLQSGVSTIHTVVLTADVFQLFIKTTKKKTTCFNATYFVGILSPTPGFSPPAIVPKITTIAVCSPAVGDDYLVSTLSLRSSAYDMMPVITMMMWSVLLCRRCWEKPIVIRQRSRRLCSVLSRRGQVGSVDGT